jgi:hypothetical protein
MRNLIVCALALMFGVFCSTVCANPIHEESILRPNASTPAGYFGSSLAIDGDVMVVGAVRDYERGVDSGSAYIFERDTNGTWIQQLKILPEDTASNDFLGVSVAVSGDFVAVGAVGDAFEPNPEPFSFTGAVYIYKKTESKWHFETKIVAHEEHDAFGMSIALSGDSLFVGAIGSKKEDPESWSTYQGKVSVYKRDSNTKPIWELSQEPMFLYNSKAYCGNAMTMNNDTLMVGAFAHSQQEPLWRENIGATSVLHHDGTDWSSSQSITPVKATSNDNFGISIAIQDDLAVFGALGDSNAGEFSGAAYVYRNIGGVWEEEAKLLPSDPEYWGAFGMSVAISNNYIIVGSPGKSNSSFTGAAYLFLNKGKVWTQEAKLMASDAMPDGWFGIATEVIDNYLVIGAPGQDNGAGALYFYNLDMIADSDNDGIPDAIDNCVEMYNPNQEDCNQNFIGDICEIAEDPSIDCQQNGIIDECELSICWVDDNCALGTCDDDFNCNHIPDYCECLTDIYGPTGSPDQITNVNDLLLVIALLGNAGGIGDINFDGMVDIGDVLLIISNWGSCP